MEISGARLSTQPTQALLRTRWPPEKTDVAHPSVPNFSQGKPAIMSHPATIRLPSTGPRVAIVGDVCRLLATGADTNGAYCQMDVMVPPGGGPPPHVHTREEEAFYVLEGTITFQLGNEQIVAGPGTFLNMPIGSEHSFKNETAEPARMLITVAPAGLEQMFLEAGHVLDDETTQLPPVTPEDIARLLAIAPKYGIEIRVPQH